jgi:hypothetical protein
VLSTNCLLNILANVFLSFLFYFANKRFGPNKFEKTTTTKAQVTSTEIFMIYDKNQCRTDSMKLNVLFIVAVIMQVSFSLRLSAINWEKVFLIQV